MFFFRLSLFVSVAIANCVFGANILYIDPVNSPSHRIWNEVLIGGLLEKGHNVTRMGRFEPKLVSNNYTTLKIPDDSALYNEEIASSLFVQSHPLMDLKLLWYFSVYLTDLDLESDALQTLLDYPKDKFDLIIFDIGCSQYFYPLIKHFGNPPVVAVSPFALPPYILDMMGDHFYSYYPVYVTPYSDQMTFWQRLENYGYYLADYFLEQYYLLGIEKKARDRFGHGIGSLAEAQKQFGILLANYDPILDLPQPLPPYIIPVGGLHVKRSGELPKDLKQILDQSSDGAIYLSFGTNIKWKWLHRDIRMKFLNAFAKLKLTVLWKYDGDDLGDLPKNVVMRKWLPQSSILGHKNVKLFITHCGALSSHEAVYYGVPIVAVPFFVDQKNNAARMEHKLLGKQLKLSSLSEDALVEGISEVMRNPIYQQRMRMYSEAFRSRKETPLERAVYWVEQALKQKDLSYLWTRSRDLNFWQRQNLDIYALALLVLSLLVAVSYLALKWLLLRVFCSKAQEKIKKN